MPHVLHLVKDPTNHVAIDTLARQAGDPSVTLSVVLLQEAVRLTEPLPGRVFRLDERRGNSGSPYPTITHAKLLDLIFSADTVVSW